MRSRVARTVGAAALCLPVLVACADTAEQDFCTQYDQLVTAAQELREQDPVAGNVEELRAAAAKVSAELDQFQAVTEGRLDEAISRLRADVDAVRQAVVAAGTEAVDTARPLIEDAMKNLNEAWAVVQERAARQCPDGG
ncbi:hypothetical protein P0Y31_11285 [Knoellia sp. 3-2P3]|nr:hypothetical protein [Knoellia sp. 3-2P3]